MRPQEIAVPPAAAEPAQCQAVQIHETQIYGPSFPLLQDRLLRYLDLDDLHLESGMVLPGAVLAYETWGRLDSQANNAILIQHALTGSTHVTSAAAERSFRAADPQRPGERGWWEDIVGPGRPIDTNTYFVVAINLLGGCYGSTGPASRAPDGNRWGSRFPFLTLRDTTRAETQLADALGIARWHAVIGGSLGGARALEWAVSYPERVGTAVVLASCAASTAEQIALAQLQTLAIRQDPHFAGGDYYTGQAPAEGLALARQIAQLSYRSEAELGQRFGRQAQPGENPLHPSRSHGSGTGRPRYQVESYLDHQGRKLANRFDANSYLVLTEALMSHDLARGRGSLSTALQAASAVRFVIAAVSSDRLYLPEQSAELAQALPVPVPVQLIDSSRGHDGFLTETGRLGALLAEHF
ncbi:homoserine O-acetyltransferase MetX [Acaricomes phytoseiuli]|uniref:homoserine O-acetyltransferase MetX n=1 Tax=Acaricomes phytoseiuli TaxID=291968 RepID=UPI000A0219E6|nr:homoserine O-acetyltransferase [Acaricomes phytoseiuli]